MRWDEMDGADKAIAGLVIMGVVGITIMLIAGVCGAMR